MAMSTLATPRDARALLVDWANQQDQWVRAIVGEALLSRRELSPAAIERVTESFLTEKQLAEGEPLEAPPLGEPDGESVASHALRLVSLRDCRGVNALSENQAIDFNPKITILFGENATGKTGYVRILKRVANVRSAEEILPDIHRANPAPRLQAVLGYSVDGEDRDLQWEGETGVSPLTRISVFDAPAVALHLDDNLTYVYTPPDLALFRYVHSAIEAVRSELEERRAETEPKKNPFITAFTRDTPIFPQIEQLGASTDLAELERLATLSKDETAEIDALKLSIETLGSQTTGGRSEMLRNRIAVLDALRTLAVAAEGFNDADLAEATSELREARQAQANAAAAVFDGDDLPEEIRPAWQTFVEAGDHYLQSAAMDAYPQGDDACIYCRQPLDASAVSLLQSYREYASGAAATAVQTADAKLRTARAPLVTDPVEKALSKLNALLPAIAEGEDAPVWAAEGSNLLNAVGTLRQGFASDHQSESVPNLQITAGFGDRLATSLTETQTTLGAVEGDATTRKELLKEQRARLATLEARTTLGRLLPEIRVYVENSAWAGKLQLLLHRFQGLLRSLTEVSKNASEEVLNQNFRRAFFEECKALRAPNVELGFPGRKGQAARSKTVSSDHSLSEVLSEGEQKVVAIADFLAEASFRGGSAPLVFDDPVTSLDHRRLGEIVRRIVALSEDHQIVVLTHNVWFASELLAQFDHREADCSFYQVLDRDGAKGVIVGGVHPRVDTPSKIGGRINKGIQDAKASADGDRTDIVEQAYDHVRAWCETVASKDLLADVTKRFQPNVAMQNLERIKPDRLSDAIGTVMPIWDRACRYIPGHSQPIETLDVRPTLEQLETDWNDLQAARKRYID